MAAEDRPNGGKTDGALPSDGCPSCGAPAPRRGSYCEQCGAVLAGHQPARRGMNVLLLACWVVLVVVLLAWLIDRALMLK